MVKSRAMSFLSHLSKIWSGFVNWLLSGLTLKTWWHLAKDQDSSLPFIRRFILTALASLFLFLVVVGLLTGRLESNLAYLKALSRITVLPRFPSLSSLPEIFKTIARCESGGSHFDDRGRVVRGRVNRHDIGLYQINEVIHRRAIAATGIDIYDEEGNIQFAEYLYEKAGLDQWRLSRRCWSRYLD